MIEYLVPLAIVGALTVGVFSGIAMGRQHAKELLVLKEERIVQLVRAIELHKVHEELLKTEVQVYQAALGSGRPGVTLDG